MEFGITAIELPVRLRPASPMSDAELERFSRKNRPLRMELEPSGEVLVMTPTQYATGVMNQRICTFLGIWAMEDGRGEASGSDAGFRLPNGAVRVPDACWVSNEKIATLPGGERHDGFPPFAPEFVVELRSETDRLADIRAKMREWIDNGAELGWMIDPRRRVVEVYRAGAAAEIHQDPTSVQGTGCVSGFCLVMKKVWG
jgi:Uma2 family endonuclease